PCRRWSWRRRTACSHRPGPRRPRTRRPTSSTVRTREPAEAAPARPPVPERVARARRKTFTTASPHRPGRRAHPILTAPGRTRRRASTSCPHRSHRPHAGGLRRSRRNRNSPALLARWRRPRRFQFTRAGAVPRVCGPPLRMSRKEAKAPMHRVVPAALCSLLTTLPALAADQTVPGAGNADAIATARASGRVRDADEFLVDQAGHIQHRQLRRETLDILTSRVVCAHHRQGLDDAGKDAIVQQLTAAGLVNPADAAAITGGVKAGVFPPALADGTACPTPPLPF